jgi:DNA polymerase-1
MRTLLVDTDMLIYRFAFAHESAMAWDEDTWTYRGDLGSAKSGLLYSIEEIAAELGANLAIHFLSDTKSNWRRDIMPQYKGHRAGWKIHRPGLLPPKPGPKRPMLWKPLREWLIAEHEARCVDGLEGDDLLGLAATDLGFGEDRIIVSDDKDMVTVPGLHFAPDRPHDGIIEVTPGQAAYNHLKQTLMGDSTDGYSGCPGIGPKRAATVLGDLDCLQPAAWDVVCATYAAKGLTEEVALMNARVAHVMRGDDYNFETGEIKLWEPRQRTIA